MATTSVCNESDTSYDLNNPNHFIESDGSTKIYNDSNIVVESDGSIVRDMGQGYKLVLTSEFLQQLDRVMAKPPKTYEQRVRKSCLPDPIVEKSFETGDEGDKFTLTVKAYKSNYGEDYKYIYWYVSCDKPYNNKPFTVHPFRFVNDDVDEDNNCIWEVVVDNEMMRKIIETLSMSDEDLAMISGYAHPIEYRARLIKVLKDLWD